MGERRDRLIHNAQVGTKSGSQKIKRQRKRAPRSSRVAFQGDWSGRVGNKNGAICKKMQQGEGKDRKGVGRMISGDNKSNLDRIQGKVIGHWVGSWGESDSNDKVHRRRGKTHGKTSL